MKQYFKGLAARVIDKTADRVARQTADGLIHSNEVADSIAYRVASETISNSAGGKSPHELFSGVSDEFWFWLLTEGRRRNSRLRNMLPGMPSEDVQLQYTGDKGDPILREGFNAYRVFRDQYETYVGPISQCDAVLDFGCGWGRIIRFFLKDVEPTSIWGADPVEEMIDLCRQANRWCNFRHIGTEPPSPFADDTFDLIYSFSVFSHLSEEMHESWLVELTRILKPGGLMVATTRNREFINHCASLRERADLASIHPGPRSSAEAFLDTRQSLADFDAGKYCFSPLAHDKWSYWGDTAIPRDYVLRRWTPHLTFVDYIDDTNVCPQNVIVMRKAGAETRND